MVTGQVPFTADTPLAIILKHVSDPLPLPSLIKPDIPASIEQIILKALAKDPKDRFATADEFLAAWKRALEEKNTVRRPAEPIPAPAFRATTTTPVTRSIPNARRSMGWAAGCLAGVCLLLSVAGVGLVALNWQNLSFLSPATDVPTQVPTNVPTNTQTATSPTRT